MASVPIPRGALDTDITVTAMYTDNILVPYLDISAALWHECGIHVSAGAREPNMPTTNMNARTKHFLTSK